MSFMYDRLALGRELMSDDGVIFSSIDDGEQANFRSVESLLFSEKNFINNIIWEKKYSPQNDAKWFSDNHDFLICYAKNKEIFRPNLLPRTEEQNNRYKNKDNDSRGVWKSSDFSVKTYSKDYDFSITTPSGRIVNPPKNRCWRTSKEKYLELINDNRIWFGEDGNNVPSIKRFLSEVKQGVVPLTIWKYKEVGHNQDAAKEISNLFYGKSYFDTPKPSKLLNRVLQIGSNNDSIVLDYFAGSGTTAHAVINLNREDQGNRKYILVEMGEYFDSVTKPRVQKVIYSDSWKDGAPQPPKGGGVCNGISQIFKYFKLESYEDTLNNLEFKKIEQQTLALDTFSPKVKEDYILNYSLDVESQESLLNIDNFKSPFNYTLKIATSSVGETKDTNIDLVETFNYLLGIVVKRMEMLKGYLVVEGQNLKKEKILIIWRDGQTSEELNEFFKKMDWSIYDREFATIYTNGDNNLGNLKKDETDFKVKLIEEEFKRLMFGE
jgi:adenine-specific DNA-methyltransferase